MLKRTNLIYIIGLIFIVSFLVSCENSEEVIKNSYYLSLSGESKNWEVNSYEVVIMPDTFSAGNGKLTMKNDKEVTSHFFSIKVHAVINGRDEVVQGKSVTVTGGEENIAQTSIGTIEGGTYFKENGDPITLKDVSDIYMIIQWQDGNQDMEERVDLYNPGDKFSF
ncbi:hypothetical protein ACTWQB_10160 [Piscibacillus sp. B03]|uniref:hypothetical protein n=1 Tax=Piscibacillus sp. B03 TaxID=3457430 RepID=UPI003FCCE1BA